MLKRILVFLLVALALLIIVPPLWNAISPSPVPEMPPAGRRVEVRPDVSVNVVERGAGPPIVLVHGLPGTAYDWRVLLDALAARGHRAIAYDRVGYGRSDPRPADSPHTVSANANELLALLDGLGLEDATVVGWSYGGATSMQAAMEKPARMSRLVLVGTGGPDSADAEIPEPPAFIRFLYSDPVLAWRSRVPSVSRGLISAISEQAYSGQPQPDWWIPDVQANFARRATLEAYRGEMFNRVDDGRFKPETIEVPTLLLHGDDDRLAPVGISEYLVTVIPGAELRVTPGGSHMLPVTHADSLADAIVAFASGSRDGAAPSN